MVPVKFAAFQTLLAFALLLQETRAGSLGEMCVHMSAGEGVLWKRWGPRTGRWLQTWSEDSGRMVTTEVSIKALPTLEIIIFRELLISHGAHLGNRHPFVDLQGYPGAGPAFQWNIWKALAPPCAKATEPWRQRSMTSSWLLLNPCPRQVFFWEPVSNTDLWCQGSCTGAMKLSLVIKGLGAEKGSG